MKLAFLFLAVVLSSFFYSFKTAGVVVAVYVGLEVIAMVVRKCQPKKVTHVEYRARPGD